jgi:hypothetical protein
MFEKGISMSLAMWSREVSLKNVVPFVLASVFTGVTGKWHLGDAEYAIQPGGYDEIKMGERLKACLADTFRTPEVWATEHHTECRPSF